MQKNIQCHITYIIHYIGGILLTYILLLKVQTVAVTYKRNCYLHISWLTLQVQKRRSVNLNITSGEKVAPISAYNARISHSLVDFLRFGNYEEDEVGIGGMDLLYQVRLQPTQAVQ